MSLAVSAEDLGRQPNGCRKAVPLLCAASSVASVHALPTGVRPGVSWKMGATRAKIILYNFEVVPWILIGEEAQYSCLEDCFETCSLRMCSPRYQEGTVAIPSIGGGIYGFEPKNSSLTLVEEAFETLLQIEAILCIAAWVWPFKSSKWCDKWINGCTSQFDITYYSIMTVHTIYHCIHICLYYCELLWPFVFTLGHCTISFHVVYVCVQNTNLYISIYICIYMHMISYICHR